VAWVAARWVGVVFGFVPVRRDEPPHTREEFPPGQLG